jgi:hypothetical protein
MTILNKTHELFSLLFSSFLVTILLWCRVASSLSVLLLVVHEEDEWYLWTDAVMKPTRGTTISFMGNTSTWSLRVVQLRYALSQGHLGLSTSIVCFVYFTLIIQVPTNQRWIYDSPQLWVGFTALVLVHLNIHKICLKLKYGFRTIHKFPIFLTIGFCLLSAERAWCLAGKSKTMVNMLSALLNWMIWSVVCDIHVYILVASSTSIPYLLINHE